MKKLLLFIALIAFSFSVAAQKVEEIKPADLPKNVTGWISQNFKNAVTNRAAKVIDNKAVVGYCAAVSIDKQKFILVFDKSGKFLERVRKMSEVRNVFQPAASSKQTKK